MKDVKAKDPKAFEKHKILQIAKRVLKSGPVCDHCLGRQLAQVSTGMTNEDRGKILRKVLKAKKTRGKCVVCSDIFKRLDKYADNASKRLEKLQYDTFLVGTKMSPEMIRSEESLWEDVGIERCEPIKSELNRELGKLIYERVKKEVGEKKPDVLVILNLEKDRIDLEIKSLFISGGYKKLVRGIPQTKWDMYPESVEDVIAAPLMRETGGEEHAMHAAGREDIDARCLDWRPFVMEIKNPVKRKIDLKKIERAVKKTKKADVSGLAFSDKKEVIEVKAMRNDKTYSVLVEFEKGVKGIEKVLKIKGCVSQRTPNRVAHRRADKTRKRKAKDIKWKKINNKKFEFQIKGEAGLYIKELVTGDDGRTRPSIAGLLKNPATVKKLDVIKIWKVGK
jgi:tRNA pseudouridine synthase 10